MGWARWIQPKITPGTGFQETKKVRMKVRVCAASLGYGAVCLAPMRYAAVPRSLPDLAINPHWMSSLLHPPPPHTHTQE